MRHVLTGQKNSNIEELITDNFSEIIKSDSFIAKKNLMSLHSKVKYLECENSDIVLNNEYSDKSVYEIACALAIAIDKNSSEDIKQIKAKYGHTEEFALAKDILNRECKKVWDVCENKSKKINIPKDAMKTLGISNKLSLDILLENSIKFFEKDNGKTTAEIITSILNNPNMDYKVEDIYEYLKTKYTNKHYHYNFETMKTLAKELDYNLYKLSAITSDSKIMKQIFKNLSVTQKIKVLFLTLVQAAADCGIV